MAQKVYGVVLIGLMLIMSISTLAVAQYELGIKEEREEYGSAPEEKSGLTPIEPLSDEGGVIYTPPYIPAPQEVIDKVDDYIISIIGEDYFAEHFKLADARKLGERYVHQNQTFEPTYRLTYNYTHELKDEPYLVEYIVRLRVYSNGELMNAEGYTGPREQYEFLIRKKEAEKIAAENGMEEPFGVSLYGEKGVYAWIAGTEQECEAAKGKIEMMFIHVDTGKVISKRISEGCITVEAELGESTAGTGAASPTEEESPAEHELETKFNETEKEIPQENNQTKLGEGILTALKSIWALVIVLALALTMLGWTAFQHIAKKRKNIMLVSFHEAEAKKMAQAIANETCKKILEVLSDGELTESEIAKKLGMSLSRIDYNLKALLDAKLVKTESYHYSEKGREMDHYSLTDKYIVIGPPKKSKKVNE